SGAAVHRLQVRLEPQRPPSSGQLLGNADMEAVQAAPWIASSCDVSISTKSHNGVQSLRVHGRNSESDAIMQDVTAQVARGALHRAEVWIHQSSDEPAASYRIVLRIDSTRGETQFVPLSQWTVCCCGRWTKLQGDAVVEWNGELESAAWFIQSNLGTITYRIDDALLETQAPPTEFHIAPGSWRQRVE
ncbi:MAG: carbohydrate binding domain-containing protein, partial [Planctomycetaceae bacterium]